MEIHVVQPGDSIYTIARQYGVDPQRIIFDNGLSVGQTLVVGQTVVVQFPGVTYTVQPGDTLDSIASYAGVTSRSLLRNNPIVAENQRLYPGQTLAITLREGEKYGPTRVYGYAYPNVDLHVLQRQLPYLSGVSMFTYGFTPAGELVSVDDRHLIELARQYHVASVMVFSCITEEGQFSQELATRLLSDMAMQEKVIGQISEVVIEKGYYGVDVDFEYVGGENRDAYTAFVARLKRRMAEIDTKVFVALPPKTSTGQKGVLYEGHDYKKLGEIADRVLLMTYEWGYSGGPPQAVAPLPGVRQVAEYAVTQIAREKILLGFPNYGYDWELPYVRGGTKATSLGNVEAVDLARRRGAVIQYDETAQAPWFQYYDPDGAEHTVWFEDARSAEAKLRLMAELRLSGLGIWQLMRPFPQLYLVLNGLCSILTVV